MRQGVLCLALRDFGMFCSDSDILRRASSWAVCFENSGLRQAISELAQRSGKALLHGFEPRLESLTPRLGLVGCPRSVSVVLSWCSANPPILDEWSAIWKLEGSLVDF
jgi:hypothetical protein